MFMFHVVVTRNFQEDSDGFFSFLLFGFGQSNMKQLFYSTTRIFI